MGLHNLYGNADIIIKIKSLGLRWVGHVAWMKDGRRACKLLLGKPEGQRPCCRPKNGWEDNIIWDMKGVNYEVFEKYLPRIE